MRTTDQIYEENKRLKQDLARVTQERDLLKKAAAAVDLAFVQLMR